MTALDIYGVAFWSAVILLPFSVPFWPDSWLPIEHEPTETEEAAGVETDLRMS